MEPLGTVPDRVLESFRLAVRPSHPEPELSLARCLLSEESGSLRIHQVIPLSPIFHPAGAYREKSAGRLDLPLQARHSNLGVVYSPPIQHGLGSGAADIRLAVQGWQDGSPCWVSGEAGLFGAPIQSRIPQRAALLSPSVPGIRCFRQSGSNGLLKKFVFRTNRSASRLKIWPFRSLRENSPLLPMGWIQQPNPTPFQARRPSSRPRCRRKRLPSPRFQDPPSMLLALS